MGECWLGLAVGDEDSSVHDGIDVFEGGLVDFDGRHENHAIGRNRSVNGEFAGSLVLDPDENGISPARACVAETVEYLAGPGHRGVRYNQLLERAQNRASVKRPEIDV